MTIEIEKGIPMPDKVRTRNGKYPWMTMDVGDSFPVVGRTKPVIVPKWLKPKIFRQGMHPPTDKIPEDHWRVWRTA